MKALLIAYSAKGLSKTDASKLSKKLLGYVDKSNKGQYTYKRKGLITAEGSIIIAKSVFIVPRNQAKDIIEEIQKNQANIFSWEIELPEKYFKN